MSGGAFYNDNEPFAVKWLRNLAEEGHIPRGTVDGRSIKEVQAADLAGFNECHFFAGIGGWAYALRLAEWPDGVPVWTASCPCQPLSSAGKRLGEKDERHLWPAFFRLVRECRPATIFGEQVASSDGLEWLAGIRADLEDEGYAFGAADLCAASQGAPIIRQRCWWVASADSQQRERQRVPVQRRESRQEDSHASGCGAISGLGSTEDTRPQRQRSLGSATVREPRRRLAGLSSDAWRDSVALECVDGAARRIGSGSFPLAHGLPRSVGPVLAGMDRVELRAAKANRVGRLKGYGNSIVPQIAAAFVRAFMDCLSPAGSRER